MSGQDAIERVAEVTGAAAAPQRAVVPYPNGGAAQVGDATAPASVQQPAAPESPGESARLASFAAALSEAEMAMLAETSMAALSSGGEGAPAGGAGAAMPLLSELQTLISTLPSTVSGGSAGNVDLLSPTATAAGLPPSYTAGLPPASYATGNPSSGVPASADGVSGAAALGALSPVSPVGGQQIGERIVRIAESQAGQHEEPMGSNEGAAVAMYRSATRGAIPGAPWCAYFVSWVARQAGEPIGSEGQGLGAVSEIWEWAQQTGRAIPNGPGVMPKPGDLIVFGDEHVGIVRGVLPSGQIETVEGNYENKVALNVRSPSEPTGYVEMG